MKLVVVSHKLCWRSSESDSGYATDGGFPVQMGAMSELFDRTSVVVPCLDDSLPDGLTPLRGKNLSVVPLAPSRRSGLSRKIEFPFWLAANGRRIIREISRADAVHAPIPGDVGTVGILIGLLFRKPLFVRHCGNWLAQRTTAEVFWKWGMERMAGGRNVMLATGGSDLGPSQRNANIKWIFSTSLTQRQINESRPKTLTPGSGPKLIIACRLERRKGVETVIESMPLIMAKFPAARLDVVGDGSLLAGLKELACRLGIDQSVTFHGKVAQSAVIRKLKEADIFCFPTSASEGFPKSVLEALACGLPVLTTKVSVLPHLLAGGCGVIVERPTKEAVAAGIEAICGDPQAFEKMSLAAIEVAKRYSLESWREQIGKSLREGWQVSSLSRAEQQ
jgi:glycosyltransferase involved in cell wall biosynthesis